MDRKALRGGHAPRAKGLPQLRLKQASYFGNALPLGIHLTRSFLLVLRGPSLLQSVCEKCPPQSITTQTDSNRV
jgi:hypothetical protein